jgi:hypothetical protein
MIRKAIWTLVAGGGLLIAALICDGVYEGVSPIREAKAIVGRPMTPVSVAGVARRTTRRTIRRTRAYAAALPRGCVTTVMISGVRLYHCGGVYYQAQGNQYVIVNVD